MGEIFKGKRFHFSIPSLAGAFNLLASFHISTTCHGICLALWHETLQHRYTCGTLGSLPYTNIINMVWEKDPAPLLRSLPKTNKPFRPDPFLLLTRLQSFTKNITFPRDHLGPCNNKLVCSS